MPLPERFRNLKGWAKATAVSATILLISLGLCGLNFGAFTIFHLPIDGGGLPGHHQQDQAVNALIYAASAEVAAILASAAALIVSSIGLLFTSLSKNRGPTST